MNTITKRRADAPPRFFEAEAAGLEWLASANGVRVASVVRVEQTQIELERIVEVHPSTDAALAFGANLARTHLAGAPAFGAPPVDWDGPLFIGSRQMATANDSEWGSFYARDRVLPFLDVAVSVGNVTAAQRVVVEEACALIASGHFDDDEPPARLHGDLWTGNLLWSASGVVLIDPAAHGGHRETDLAMLALFGCPNLDEIVRGYEGVAPLRAGWQQRIPLHQLHPLAVHAAGHGPHYGVALWRAAIAVLEG